MASHASAKQEWLVGKVVKIGFAGNFLIVKKIPTPGDHAPDKYLVLRENTKKFYEFTPHLGLRVPDSVPGRIDDYEI